MAAGRRIPLDRINLHLIVASTCMLLYHFNYHGLLGARGDWNLFASAALPLSVLVWRTLLEAGAIRFSAGAAIGWGVLSQIHTCLWIWSNHTYEP